MAYPSLQKRYEMVCQERANLVALRNQLEEFVIELVGCSYTEMQERIDAMAEAIEKKRSKEER